MVSTVCQGQGLLGKLKITLGDMNSTCDKKKVTTTRKRSIQYTALLFARAVRLTWMFAKQRC